MSGGEVSLLKCLMSLGTSFIAVQFDNYTLKSTVLHFGFCKQITCRICMCTVNASFHLFCSICSVPFCSWVLLIPSISQSSNTSTVLHFGFCKQITCRICMCTVNASFHLFRSICSVPFCSWVLLIPSISQSSNTYISDTIFLCWAP